MPGCFVSREVTDTYATPNLKRGTNESGLKAEVTAIYATAKPNLCRGTSSTRWAFYKDEPDTYATDKQDSIHTKLDCKTRREFLLASHPAIDEHGPAISHVLCQTLQTEAELTGNLSRVDRPDVEPVQGDPMLLREILV